MARKEGSIHLIAPSLRKEISYLDRLSEEPTVTTTVNLNEILDSAFIASQAFVHVISGRLRASGRKTSSVRRTARRNVWQGEITYGEGLDYSKYEFGNRGFRESWPLHPSHDPFDGLEVFYEAFDEVIGEIF